MDKKQLSEMGAFISDQQMEKRLIRFKLKPEDEQETEAEIFVRHISVGLHEDIFTPAIKGDASSTARLLSEAIRLGPEGKERLTYIEAYSLLPSIARAMVMEISKVNGLARKN